MKKLSTFLMISFFAVLLAAGSAMAVPILDFGVIAPTSGSISYAGGNTSLIGINIDIDNVVGLDTYLNDGVDCNLFNATLNFTTGASNGVWTWGGGTATSISIVGGVDLNDNDIEDAGDIPTATTLLTGTFGSAEVFYLGGEFHITGGSFTDFKDEDLLEFYGLPTTINGQDPMPYSGNFNISFKAEYNGYGAAFVSEKVLSGDIINTPVPEPATMLLLGAGLIGLAGVGRKKFNK